MRAKTRTIGVLMRGLALVIFWTVATAGKIPSAKAIDLSLAIGRQLQTPAAARPVLTQSSTDIRAKSVRFRPVEDLLDAVRPCVAVAAPPSVPPVAPKGSPGAKN